MLRSIRETQKINMIQFNCTFAGFSPSRIGPDRLNAAERVLGKGMKLNARQLGWDRADIPAFTTG
jgi:hypothetical protein